MSLTVTLRWVRPGVLICLAERNFNVINEQAVFSFTDTGSEAFLQLYQQPGISFTRGKTYEMTFIAKSNAGRSFPLDLKTLMDLRC